MDVESSPPPTHPSMAGFELFICLLKREDFIPILGRTPTTQRLTEPCLSTLATICAAAWSSSALDDNSYTKQQRHPFYQTEAVTWHTLPGPITHFGLTSIVAMVMEKP
ncbi:hypothetical protein ECG_08889 [Echinococcus granulosus]|nr:hypothetical protein ECG_08889 [Echinococcus granulosus]